MSEEFDLDIDKDPELLDDEEEGQGGDEHYDGVAVETVDYDHSAFELPGDFEPDEEVEDEDDSDDDTNDAAGDVND